MMVRPAWLLSAFFGVVVALADTDTITWGGDNSRSGYQDNHNLDPAIVRSDEFGQIFKTRLPGNWIGADEVIYSQPLVYTPNGSNKQYVYFATTQNNVYKLDAKTGEIVASRNLHIPFLTRDLDGCVDINPTVGVIGTGVIDPETETLYLTAKTYLNQNAGEVAQGRDAGRYYIHAIDVNDLSERENYPINLEGTIARNNPTRMFTAGIHNQRPGLLHQGQYIYAAFGSHCVQYNITGWVIGWDKTTGTLVERFATQGEGVPNDVKGASIWMSGGGLAADDAGSMFYATGNGYASQLAEIPVSGFNPPTSLEEAAVHMSIAEDGSLSVVDFFMPHEKRELDGADKDLGTSTLEILPSEFACGDVKRIGVVTGKSGKTYWLNLDNLGGYRTAGATVDNVIQVYQNENSVYAGAGVYPLEGGYVYINVINYPTHAFKFSCNNGVPSFAKVADSPNKNAGILGVSHGTVTTLDGKPGTGLLWNTDVQGDNVKIYDAVPVNGVLNQIKTFKIDGVTKFTRAVFGDGTLYVGTTKGYVYGFGSPNTVPLNCTANVDFGTVDISEDSPEKTITCVAVTGTTVDKISLDGDTQYALSGLPNLPLQLASGARFTLSAKFQPESVGLASESITIATKNVAKGFSSTTFVSITGKGASAGPLLSVSPARVSFDNIVVGSEATTVNAILSNGGDSELTISSVQYSEESIDGPFETWSGNGALTVGKFVVRNIPNKIQAMSDSTIGVQFNPSESGDFTGYVKFTTNGGQGSISINGTAGAAPVARIEFQTIDGTDWVPYSPDTPFTFGNVTENTSRSLRFRVTNDVEAGGVKLSLTVSKPPFGINSIVRAANTVDLGEGTILAPGESASAVMSCSVPKSQWNVDPYDGYAPWTMNTNDPNFEKHFFNFTCKAVSEQAPPLLPNGLGEYRYLGCFKENNPGRQLERQLYGNDASTSGMCIEACDKGNYVFCGTQYHRECWAGNKIPTLRVDERNCNFDCSGDLNQICGGNGVNGGAFISLFVDSLQWDGNSTIPDDPDEPNDPDEPDDPDEPGNPGGPFVNPGVNGYISRGCYTEATTGRALKFEKKVEDLTVAKCVKACAESNYLYAGLEYSQECWCDNQLGAGAEPAPANGCSLTCKGNSTEYCGGHSRLNVYRLGEEGLETTSVAASATTSVVTTTTTTPSTTPTGPAIREEVGNWRFRGCWTETNNGGRALSGATLADDEMTPEMCAEFCDGFALLGIEYGRECYCGNTLRVGSVEAESGCSFLCPGDESTFCGGSMRLQLFDYGLASTTTEVDRTPPAGSAATSGSSTSPVSTYISTTSVSTFSTTTSSSFVSTTSSTSISTGSSTASSSSIITAESSASTTSTTKVSSTSTSSSTAPTHTVPYVDEGNGNFTYYACVQEPSSGRLMDDQIFNDGEDMTIDACLERCWKYSYAGVEYGRECWCGDTLDLEGNAGATPGKNVTDKECTFRCPGDDDVFCGDRMKMNLYVRKDLELD